MQRKPVALVGGDEEQQLVELTRVKVDCRQRMAPLSVVRVFSLIMLPFVFGLVLLSCWPFWYLVRDGSLGGEIKFAVFTTLVSLLLASYLQTVYTDAGSVPMEWHDLVQQQTRPGFAKCRKSQLFKPLRSHYDGMSQRLILNEDHFCPWVANVVGFRNRKFFILFCIYTTVASGFAAWVLYPHAFAGIDLSRRTGGKDVKMSAICLMAVVLDITFTLALSVFSLSHLYMAMRNQTSIEDSSFSKRYDRGWRENLKTVFGQDWRMWALPIYAQGPMGDGVHWQLVDGTWDGFADRSPPPPPPSTAANGPITRT
ncbi:hypothetical protein BASA81_001745 [Batrachochytrium salamandrivorans]|nr:hypothetical protein BASA81_001745 [Batrachochytrium salamandrivorans]